MTMVNSTSSSFYSFHYNLIALYVSEILRDHIITFTRDFRFYDCRMIKRYLKFVQDNEEGNEKNRREIPRKRETEWWAGALWSCLVWLMWLCLVCCVVSKSTRAWILPSPWHARWLAMIVSPASPPLALFNWGMYSHYSFHLRRARSQESEELNESIPEIAELITEFPNKITHDDPEIRESRYLSISESCTRGRVQKHKIKSIFTFLLFISIFYYLWYILLLFTIIKSFIFNSLSYMISYTLADVFLNKSISLNFNYS